MARTGGPLPFWETSLPCISTSNVRKLAPSLQLFTLSAAVLRTRFLGILMPRTIRAIARVTQTRPSRTHSACSRVPSPVEAVKNGPSVGEKQARSCQTIGSIVTGMWLRMLQRRLVLIQRERKLLRKERGLQEKEESHLRPEHHGLIKLGG